MSEIVNLRQVRKAKARAAAADKAAENRQRFGANKAERTIESKNREIARRHLDGHRRTPDSDDA